MACPSSSRSAIGEGRPSHSILIFFKFAILIPHQKLLKIQRNLCYGSDIPLNSEYRPPMPLLHVLMVFAMQQLHPVSFVSFNHLFCVFVSSFHQRLVSVAIPAKSLMVVCVPEPWVFFAFKRLDVINTARAFTVIWMDRRWHSFALTMCTQWPFTSFAVRVLFPFIPVVRRSLVAISFRSLWF